MTTWDKREQYRQMTNAERFELTLKMIEESIPWLLSGPADVVDRRFERIRQENDERNRRTLEALARTRNQT